MQTEKQNLFRVISGNYPDKQPEKELSLVIMFCIVLILPFCDVNLTTAQHLKEFKRPLSVS